MSITPLLNRRNVALSGTVTGGLRNEDMEKLLSEARKWITPEVTELGILVEFPRGSFQSRLIDADSQSAPDGANRGANHED